jgi:hypothetical protein
MAVTAIVVNPKGVQEHIITAMLIYDSFVSEARSSQGASEIRDLMDLESTNVPSHLQVLLL